MNETAFQKIIHDGTHRARYETERFLAELAFARTLCEFHPDRVAEWQPLIDKAEQAVQKAVEAGTLDGLQAAVRAAEALLDPLRTIAKTYTVHCVGHAHIDMNWMWSWPETVAVTNDTFTTVLRLMDEYRDFRFSQSQASVYAIMERYNPALLKKIAARVRQGRWEVTASHWVEAEKNIAGGESLCRHILYTRRYMQRLFGLKPEDVNIDWSPDTFGHPATVPTYLVRGGIQYLYLHRPGIHGPKRPGAFWWQGPDGSRVLVRNDMALGYNGQIGPQLGQLLAAFTRETGSRDYMFVYGVGDHGGGPTRRDVHRALDLDTWPVFPRVRFSTARTFYETLEKQSARLPTLDCELNTEFTGCYTTQTLIKKANRFSENGLLAAETSSALAWSIARHDYPNGEFVESWRDMLFSHFHDILPGSGVHDTRTYCHGMYQRIMAATSMAETRALRHLASLIDTSGAGPAGPVATIPSVLASGLGAGVGFSAADGRMSAAEQSAGQGPRPFLLFHTNPGQRNAVVEAVVWDNAPHGVGAPLRQRPLAVKGPDGTTVPAQVVHSGGYWGHEFVTLAFPAKIDGIGYAVYTVVEEQAKAVEPRVWHLGRKHHCPYAFNERSPEGLENECVRIEIDTTTGGIRSLVDKRSGRTLMAATGAAPALEYGVERPHGMTSWAIDHTGPIEPPEVTGIRRKLDGPYKAALEVSLRIHESDFALTYELRAGEPLVYLHLEGTWFERGTPQTGIPVLRFAFPFTLEDARARYEIPFGAIDRDIHNGDEVPALQWAQVSGTAAGAAAGCLLLNDSKHGHSLDGNVLRLTLIRSSYDPDPLPEIGRHEIHVALMPFGGDISAAEATRIARDFNLPIRVMGTDVHPGDLPTHAQWVSLSPANVILSGLKKSEDSDALVFRLYETAGEKARAELKFNADCLGEVVDVQEVDLMERPVLKSTAKARAKAVSVAIPPRGIATVCVRLKRKT